MNIQLIEGNFRSNDALDLITQMIQIKIRYHEGQIGQNDNEEDIKWREAKIKRLQNNLFELRSNIGSTRKGVQLSAVINIVRNL